MAQSAYALPYGLRDVKITPWTNGTLGTKTDLPNAQVFSFEEGEEFEELRGDDVVVAKRGSGPDVSWTLESGGISLEAYAIMNGGAVTVTGVTPSAIKSYRKKNTDSRPEFQVEGQAMSESGGDFHTKLYRVKAEKVSGSLEDKTFWISKAEGTAMGDLTAGVTLGAIYDFVHNETAAAIA